MTSLAQPPAGSILTLLAEIPEEAAIVRDFAHGDQRWSVILARRDGRVFAYENICPHAGQPLDRPDGSVTVDMMGFLVCAAHLASFRIEDGAYAGGPCGPRRRGLKPVAVRIEGVAIVMGAAPDG